MNPLKRLNQFIQSFFSKIYLIRLLVINVWYDPETWNIIVPIGVCILHPHSIIEVTISFFGFHISISIPTLAGIKDYINDIKKRLRSIQLRDTISELASVAASNDNNVLIPFMDKKKIPYLKCTSCGEPRVPQQHICSCGETTATKHNWKNVNVPGDRAEKPSHSENVMKDKGKNEDNGK